MEEKEGVNNPTSIGPKEYMVRINCMTYNQSSYIEDAMNGFCIQQTAFPFVAVIIDDASTDGESEVIKNYLQTHFLLNEKEDAKKWETNEAYFVFARHKTNKNCYFAVIFLKTNYFSAKKAKGPLLEPWLGKSKYIALCEGDDYWIHPQKLQMQVSFLESHLEYAMSYSKAFVINDKNNNRKPTIIGKETSLEEILTSMSPIPTASACIRMDLLPSYSKERKSEPAWKLGDIPMWAYFKYHYKIHFIDDVLTAYRELDESASHSIDFHKRTDFINNAYQCRQFYAKKYIGDIFAKKVAKIRIKNLLYLSFQNNKKLKVSLLKDIWNNKIFDTKLFILAILSYNAIGRKIVNKRIKQ